MYLILLIFVLLGVAFYTLFERKVLGLSQRRLGPNKLIFWGILQPVMDGLKLIFKEEVKLWNISYSTFFIPSFLLFFVIMQVWFLIAREINMSFLIFLLILGTMVYRSILIGIISNSKYASLGRLRNACQAIRYEISIRFQIISFLLVWKSLVLDPYLSFLTFLLPLLGIWWISCVCECNRAPFDFAEGERELISGFNIEYSSMGFIFIFLGEYGIILVLRRISRIIFFNCNLFIFFCFFFSFILLRTTFIRLRFDLLIIICWYIILPLRISFCLISGII